MQLFLNEELTFQMLLILTIFEHIYVYIYIHTNIIFCFLVILVKAWQNRTETNRKMLCLVLVIRCVGVDFLRLLQNNSLLLQMLTREIEPGAALL